MRRVWNVAAVSVYLVVCFAFMVVSGRFPLREILFRPVAIWRDRRGSRSVSARPRSGPATAGGNAVEERDDAPAPRRWDGLVEILRCTECGGELNRSDDSLICERGHVVPIVRGIPRFVRSEGYVDSFGFEWNTHPETQLDSVRGDGLSEQTLRDKTDLGPEQVRDKLVLDAGVGTGRFSEIVARWGGTVVGVDLSLAVEAAARNLGGVDRAAVAQADIARLPFAPGTFDVVFSIGVLHHTSDTRAHLLSLARLVKPGGTLAVWVYPRRAAYVTRARWIPFTHRIPNHMFHDWCAWFVPRLVANHERIWAQDVARIFPYSCQGHGIEWDVLDTFDGYSPRYHGVHAPAEVVAWFEEAGFRDIRVLGVETSVRGTAGEARGA